MSYDVGLISPLSAIQIAKNAAVTGPGFTVDVVAANGQFVELRLIRMIGGVERVHSVMLSRAMEVSSFIDAARRFWSFLKLEHERTARHAESSTQ